MKPGTILLFCFLSFYSFLNAQDTNSTASPPKIFQLHGTISVRSTLYYATGITNRRKPFSWYLTGAPMVSAKGFFIPVTALAGEPDRYYRQPFNQFGLSPSYKWLTFHAGYRNLNFSPFTLGGHSFLGAAVEANPGKLRASVMYGRMQKAVGEDPLLPYDIMPAYKRMGYGAKIGYGSPSGYIDLSIFRAKDDTSARHRRYTASGLKPQENLVTGIKIHQELFHKITWEADFALSALNHDSRSLQVILPKMKWLNGLGNIFQPRNSTELLKASQSSLSYQSKKIQLRAGYRRIEPGYKSLGAYYMQNDLEDYQLSAGYYFLSGKLNLKASIGLQHDNLKKTLLQTTRRTTTSADISYNPSSGYGFDLQYFNFGVVQQKGINPLSDSIRIAQANHHFSTTHRFTKLNEKRMRNIFIILTYQDLTDLNPISARANASSNTFFQWMYSYSLIPAQFSFNGAFQWTGTKTSAGFNAMKGVTISASKGFLEEAKLLTTFSLGCFGNTYHSFIGTQQFTSSVISSTAAFIYSLKKKHSFSLDLGVLNNRAIADPFTEFTATTGYSFRF